VVVMGGRGREGVRGCLQGPIAWQCRRRAACRRCTCWRGLPSRERRDRSPLE
jgi:hypothetical protein